MKGVATVCCALVAVQGAMGFVAPLSTRALVGQAKLSSVSSVRTQSCSSHTRLCMSTTELPKFSVSLMDDTRVTFDLEKENLQKLAAEVGQTSYMSYGLLGSRVCTRVLVQRNLVLVPW